MREDMDYGMFTDTGNAMIHGIVQGAKEGKLRWPEVIAILDKISQVKGYGEAMDTEVRECVYSALGFKTAFYC
jgi:hypothetical protein